MILQLVDSAFSASYITQTYKIALLICLQYKGSKIRVYLRRWWVDLLTFVDKCEHAEVSIYQVILITVGSLCW